MLLMAQATAPQPPSAPEPDGQAVAAPEVQEGAVELECRVRRDRRMSDCVILSETPPGLGFGAAALTAARRARLPPRSVDGVVRDGKVRFRTTFQLQDPPAA